MSGRDNAVDDADARGDDKRPGAVDVLAQNQRHGATVDDSNRVDALATLDANIARLASQLPSIPFPAAPTPVALRRALVQPSHIAAGAPRAESGQSTEPDGKRRPSATPADPNDRLDASAYCQALQDRKVQVASRGTAQTEGAEDADDLQLALALSRSMMVDVTKEASLLSTRPSSPTRATSGGDSQADGCADAKQDPRARPRASTDSPTAPSPPWPFGTFHEYAQHIALQSRSRTASASDTGYVADSSESDSEDDHYDLASL